MWENRNSPMCVADGTESETIYHSLVVSHIHLHQWKLQAQILHCNSMHKRLENIHMSSDSEQAEDAEQHPGILHGSKQGRRSLHADTEGAGLFAQ